ncbi:DUF6290 family protein [Enterococcus casseliflavus]|uniref:DUF6290 family protein n=1 Tax=Enterococcus casseliflavus TaxID=37734 RepID=UPI003D126DA0
MTTKAAKTEFLQIRITKEDKAAIKEVAQSKGMTVTELIRTTFLDKKSKEEATK